MTSFENEAAAAAALHEAQERAVYAALVDDSAAAADARADADAAREKIAKARRGRVQAKVRARLEELDAEGPDPVQAALAGGRAYPDLRDDLREGRLGPWLSPAERDILAEQPSALRHVLAARRAGTDPRAAVDAQQRVRASKGYVLAARTAKAAEVRKVAALIERALRR